MIAKYFATSFAMENVVSEPRVISNCLPHDGAGHQAGRRGRA
jgi:hypothetical protein